MTATMRRAAPPFVLFLLAVAAWQVVGRWSGAVGTPTATAVRLGTLMRSARFWGDVAETGQAFAWALVVSTVGGVALGAILGLRRGLGDVVEPIVVSFYALPKVTLYPVVLLVFGLGLSAKVAFGVMHGMVPVTLLTRSAISQLKPVYGRTARVMRIGAVETALRIMLPAIAPDLIAGVRIGFSLSLLGVLIGEMFASKRGLGFAAMNAMGLGDIDTIMAMGLFIAAFAVLSNVVLLAVERSMRRRTAAM